MKNLKTRLIGALRWRQAKSFIRLESDTTLRLDKFNAMWQDAYVHVPFYSEWKQQHSLPDRIESLKELASWPILEKQDLILNRDKLVRKGIKRYHESVTGGATGEPLHFRTMAGESDIVAANKWIGWARMGIYPDSRCFLLWGHRHFYGQGFKSNLKFAWRRVKDWMTNNLRMDATNLSPSALEKDVRRLIRFKPECVIAYSASLLALVRCCSMYREQCQRLGIKAIICTAGPLRREERNEIGLFFNAPVGMEYGSMDAGVIAYQTPMTFGRYKVFNNTHIIHADNDGNSDGSQIIVTTLTPRYLPLFRYRIGDYMTDPEFLPDYTVKGFSEVFGRAGDIVDLGDGIRFHVYSLMVCAEENPKIIAHQLKIMRAARKIIFVAQTSSALTAEEKRRIKSHAADVASINPDCIEVEESTDLVKAPSGKIRLVIEEL